jgi:hypothetical protein
MEDEENLTAMENLQNALAQVNRRSTLGSAVNNVDKIIEFLSAARERVAGALDPHTASLTMAKLQNPTKVAFDKVNEDLRDASSSHKKLGKALDKVFPSPKLSSGFTVADAFWSCSTSPSHHSPRTTMPWQNIPT